MYISLYIIIYFILPYMLSLPQNTCLVVDRFPGNFGNLGNFGCGFKVGGLGAWYYGIYLVIVWVNMPR